jgi:hypothetical protein
VSGTVGPLVAPWNVEQAALTTLRDHLFIYLAEVERKNGLEIGAIPRPPSDASFYGGIDFDSFQQDLTPSVIVSATRPATRSATRTATSRPTTSRSRRS